LRGHKFTYLLTYLLTAHTVNTSALLTFGHSGAKNGHEEGACVCVK